ncbi:MAG: amidohydrolase family protein, partial [Acidobacteria bacterium]|nr:amidohydrolase family protein [Acidobacteriota bacterium]
LEADVIPYGITSFADPAMASNNQPIQHAFQRVANRKEGLPARVNLMIRIPVRALSAEACIDLIQGLLFEPPFKNDFFRVGTFQLSMDKGYPGAKPYIVPEEKGKKVLIEAHRAGWQLYVHITTPETFDYVSEALEEAYRLYPRQDARHVFTHIPYPTQENIDTMKRLGIIANLQVTHIYHTADDAEETESVDPKRPHLGSKPLATYRDAGIPLILSSDQAPVGPLFSIWEAVNRVRKSGKVYQPEERLTLEEAIRAVTITPAWAFFEDDVKGSIEAGKFADLVVLGKDLLTVDPMEIKDIPVLMTITGGKLVYVNPNQDPDQKVEYYRYPARTSYLE